MHQHFCIPWVVVGQLAGWLAGNPSAPKLAGPSASQVGGGNVVAGSAVCRACKGYAYGRIHRHFLLAWVPRLLPTPLPAVIAARYHMSAPVGELVGDQM